MLVDIVNEQVKENTVFLIVINNLVDEKLLSTVDKRCKILLLRRKMGGKGILPWIKMNYQLLLFHPDIIHCHLEGYARMILNPAPKVFTIHNITSSGREYGNFKALFAISDAVKEYTQKQGFEAVTIYNGIHPETILQKTKKYPSQELKIVSVGRLFNPHKGHDLLIKSAGELINKHGITDFHIDIIGDGPSRGELTQMIVDNNLSGHVTLLGGKDRAYVYSHLKDYDLFVLPSRFEGFGLSVVEAVCANIEVLISDLGGPMEVICGGKYGLHFKCGDPSDLAAQIRFVIENGVDDKMVKNAYDYACKNFDITRVAQQYVEEYKKVLNA